MSDSQACVTCAAAITGGSGKAHSCGVTEDLIQMTRSQLLESLKQEAYASALVCAKADTADEVAELKQSLKDRRKLVIDELGKRLVAESGRSLPEHALERFMFNEGLRYGAQIIGYREEEEEENVTES